MLRLVLIFALLSCTLSAHAFHTTEVPPLVDVPVWSMATLNEDGSTNFNILTYATPVAIRPDRLYCLGLFKKTKSFENFCRERKCVLLLLTDKHIPYVRLLGGKSGKDIDKEVECAKLSDPGFALQEIDGDDTSMPKVLPSCAYYLKLSVVGDIADGGESHDIATCKVDEILLPGDGDYVANSEEYLSTAKLRALGIITEQGRIAE
mmetsp:Transcript_19299/g.31992  ORF Transcript_19299/g.31992 Transcript_19299/m.31992 type:complete len:206 (+) Transcript_19299:180-797(+)